SEALLRHQQSDFRQTPMTLTTPITLKKLCTSAHDQSEQTDGVMHKMKRFFTQTSYVKQKSRIEKGMISYPQPCPSPSRSAPTPSTSAGPIFKIQDALTTRKKSEKGILPSLSTLNFSCQLRKQVCDERKAGENWSTTGQAASSIPVAVS